MTTTPLGPVMVATLQSLAGGDAFDQAALHRLYRLGKGSSHVLLPPATVAILDRATIADHNGVTDPT